MLEARKGGEHLALSCYCRKCKMDVPASSVCPRCGTALPPSSQRSAFCVDHRPVADWMCWNSVMRIVLPVFFLVIVLVPLLEGLSGGTHAVETLLSGSFLLTMLELLAALMLLVLILLLFQGNDVLDIVVDSRGVHVRTFLPEPTFFKLLARFQSPSLAGTDDMPQVQSLDLSWSQVRRVQLWPEKNLVLFYSPVWWMRVSIPCTPFTYPDVLHLVREKLGKKKQVIKPGELTVEAPKKAGTRKTSEKTSEKKTAGTAVPAASRPVDEAFLQQIREMNAYDEMQSRDS